MVSAKAITAVITADTRDNGYDHDKAAIKFMLDGVHYECVKIEVGRCSSSVQLLGSAHWFNTVNFEFFKDGKPYDIYNDVEFCHY